ncbi:HD domain-containing protein [Deinococcus sp. QL22]|uniref:HD domain-containing protein n=1 Tax=Deinococcus sp. QL22 TaxID=2939437 RepID=UPI00201798E7|nr:HD domain-containing protein [Deinococcus sp. QL22]UQN07323.1 HD domain-containing protein [Deinococcus sp. QL22]
MTFPLTEKFTEALQLAHKWHFGQNRKGTQTPYLSHLLGVASVALEFGATEAEAIAALLHDALEDGPENLTADKNDREKVRKDLETQIQAKFGAEVAALVRGATEETPLVNGQKPPWAERKLDYLAKLGHEGASSLLVSAADKLHNARTILTDVLTEGTTPEAREAFFSRFSQGREGTLQYYRLLADAYRQAEGAAGRLRLQALFAELERTVSALEVACGVTPDEVRGYALLRPASSDDALGFI